MFSFSWCESPQAYHYHVFIDRPYLTDMPQIYTGLFLLCACRDKLCLCKVLEPSFFDSDWGVVASRNKRQRGGPSLWVGIVVYLYLWVQAVINALCYLQQHLGFLCITSVQWSITAHLFKSAVQQIYGDCKYDKILSLTYQQMTMAKIVLTPGSAVGLLDLKPKMTTKFFELFIANEKCHY